jgi:DNA-binding PucR family transcriptional regulator
VTADVAVALTVVPPQVRLAKPDGTLRRQLSNLDGLLVLAMIMTESGEERQILRLALTAVPALGPCRSEGVLLAEGGWQTVTTDGGAPGAPGLAEQVATLGSQGGPIRLASRPWCWAYPLRGLTGSVGYLVVSAPAPPESSEQFLLRVLAQQTGVALVNARLHHAERTAAEKLASVNLRLEQTVQALERSMAIHKRLTAVATSGAGRDGIAKAVHELTGYPVAVEDRYGNLRAWAGPQRPDPYPKDAPARREELLRRLLREARVLRDGGRLLALASPRDDALGVLVLVDPAGTAGEHELVALEHGATVLSMELARLRSLAEAELRLRRDLVEDLLTGTAQESLLDRAHALGYDLEREHRVVVLEGRSRVRDQDAFLHAVRRAARDVGAGPLLVFRAGTVVLVSPAELAAERLRTAVLVELGGGSCRVGVGGPARRPADVQRSYEQARFALRLQASSGGPERATRFDDLGVYRLLSGVSDLGALEESVRGWLGALLAYDETKGAELVKTLAHYLECGGNYDATALALSVHRSTLKYRLQRIREISGHNLADPDTSFHLAFATRAWRAIHALRS